MQETLSSIIEQFQRPWPFRWLGLIGAVIVSAIASAVVLFLPDVYTASSQISIAQSGDRAALPIHNAEVRFLNEAALDKILSEVDLGVDISSPASRQQAKSSLRSRIALEGTDTGLFVIKCSDLDPQRARDICVVLLGAFKDSVAQNADTTALKNQLVTEQIALNSAQKDLQEYQTANLDILGQGGLLTRLDAARTAQDQAQYAYEIAQERRTQFQRIWLATRNTSSYVPQSTLAPPSGDSMIDSLYTTYATLEGLRARYSEDYPDVLVARRQIEAIVRQYPPNLQMCSGGSAPPMSAGDEPTAAEELVIDRPTVDASAANIAVCRALSQLTLAEKTVADLQVLNVKAPPIEAKFAALTAERDAETDRVNALRRRIQDLDVGDPTTLYTVIASPTSPRQPSSPNRRLWLLAGLGVALAAGVALAYVRGALANTIVNPAEVRRTFNLPFYGALSAVSGLGSRLEQSAQIGTFLLAVGFLVAAMLALIAVAPHLSMPEALPSLTVNSLFELSRFAS